MQYHTVGPDHPSRPAIEAHIRHVYRRAYGAAVRHFPQDLAVAVDEWGEPVCAAGMRGTANGFFSEAYLDEPVEAAIYRLTGQTVPRARFVEVSNLASVKPGAAMGLFDFITRTSNANGRDWAFFTATASLRRYFRRHGAPLIEISPALPERLADAGLWGRYYEADPRVCAFRNASDAPVRFQDSPKPVIPLVADDLLAAACHA